MFTSASPKLLPKPLPSSVIDGEPLRWRGDTYHPYHFNCANCEVELTHQAREVKSRPGYTVNQMVRLTRW